jgi:hypothetical protein
VGLLRWTRPCGVGWTSWSADAARRRPLRQKDPLRALSDDERTGLRHLSRSGSEAAAMVTRAKARLVVAHGAKYTAVQVTGCRSGDALARLVARFNQEGLEALMPGHGGGRRMRKRRHALGGSRACSARSVRLRAHGYIRRNSTQVTQYPSIT